MRAARAEWTRRRQPRMRQEPHRLVFVDECATKTNMTRARGRARRGVRVRDHAPHRHAGTQTFIAGLRYDRLVAPWLLEGAMDHLAFETWVETQLAPGLCKGDVVILDNLAVHKSPKVAKRTLLFSGSGQDSGGNGATDDGATCGLMPDCGLVVPIGAHAGAALVSRKT